MRRGKYTGSLPAKGNVCFIQNCRSKWLQKLEVRLSYFKIPKPVDEKSAMTHEKWKDQLGIKRDVTWLRVCELHFEPHCFIRDLEAELTGRPVRKRLEEGSLPTLYLSREENTVPDLEGDTIDDVKRSQVLASIAQSLRRQGDSELQNQNEESHTCVVATTCSADRQGLKRIAPKPYVTQDNQILSTKSTALGILFTTPSNSSVAGNLIVEDDNLSEVEKLKARNANQEKIIVDLRQRLSDLSMKLSLQASFVKSAKRKMATRESVIKKLRSDMSNLRKERRKLRQREYMRKFKQVKVAEKRRERRAWICKQIEAGVMDKSSLALVYSRKALPFEKTHQEDNATMVAFSIPYDETPDESTTITF